MNKQLLLILFLTLTCASSASASIAYVSASGTLCNQTTASAGVACTLAGSTTAGNDVVVGLSWKTTTRSINNIVGSASKSYSFVYAQGCNGSGTCSAIAICVKCAALTTVTPTFTGTTLYTLSVAEYSGVAWVGFTSPLATGTSTAPAVTMTTGDANDWIVTEFSALATGGIPTSNTGNLRQANRTGTTSSNVAGALCDNTVASAGSVKCQVTITSVAWDGIGVELRTTAPKTYIWPDCDSTHPCIVHEKDTVSFGPAGDALTTPLYITVPPVSAGNVINMTISMPDSSGTPALTLTTPTDDKSNTWAAGATVDDTSNHIITSSYHVCNPATGTSKISMNWTGGAYSGTVITQIRYDEMSGLASSGPTTCSDGGHAASGLQGALQPGSFTTTVNGDEILTTAVGTSTSIQNSAWAGMMQPDDVDTIVFENTFQQYAMMAFVQGTAGATNPTLSANAQDPNNTGGLTFNIISDAFKPSSGTGTQPSIIQVVLDAVWFSTTGSLAWNPLPSEGNAIVFSTSNPITGYPLTGLNSNLGETYTAIANSSATTDPQIYSTCLGSAAVQRDRVWNFPSPTTSTHIELYTIAGAKTSGGSTGCVGATANNKTQTQGATTNTNVVGDPVFTPTINSGAYSVVISTSYVGTGPPSGLCISGGVTPPSCTGQSAGVVFNSLWAAGMSDTSGYSAGDPYVLYYTNSTSSKSLDYLMANGIGGTVLDGAAIEIEGQSGAAPVKCFMALLGAGLC